MTALYAAKNQARDLIRLRGRSTISTVIRACAVAQALALRQLFLQLKPNPQRIAGVHRPTVLRRRAIVANPAGANLSAPSSSRALPLLFTVVGLEVSFPLESTHTRTGDIPSSQMDREGRIEVSRVRESGAGTAGDSPNQGRNFGRRRRRVRLRRFLGDLECRIAAQIYLWRSIDDEFRRPAHCYSAAAVAAAVAAATSPAQGSQRLILQIRWRGHSVRVRERRNQSIEQRGVKPRHQEQRAGAKGEVAEGSIGECDKSLRRRRSARDWNSIRG